MKYKVGQKVRALAEITEGGYGVPGDPSIEHPPILDRDPELAYAFKFPPPAWIHANPGDLGCVEYIDEDGVPTVRFCRTQTATIVGDEEIEVLNT
jgi:hypothetical protein